MHVQYFNYASGRSPVREFIQKLPKKELAHVMHVFHLIDKYGIIDNPYIVRKKLRGTILWEIKIVHNASIRLLYVMGKSQTVILLSGFYKKSQKTPLNEIATAIKRAKAIK